MSWNIKTPGDYINGPLTVAGAATFSNSANFNGGALAGYLNGFLMFGSSGNTLNLFAQSSGFHVKNNSGTFPLLTLNNSGDFTIQDGAGNGRLILNSTGLGVGSSPAGLFRFTAFGSSQGLLVNKNGINQLLAVSMKNNTQDYCLFVDQDGIGSDSWSVFDNTNLHTAQRYYPGASGYWQFLVNNVQRLRLNNTGAAILAGGNNSANGVGITFPAAQSASTDANTLDDYEEGTWTATVKGSTTDPTTPVTAVGRYTKVGRQVTVQLYVSNKTTTGASGRIQIAGLPFANNSSDEIVSSVGFYDIANFTGAPYGLTSQSGTVVDMWSSVSNGIFQPVNHNPGTGRYMWLNMTYTV